MHPINATATGVSGSLKLGMNKSGIAAAPKLAGEVRVALHRLQSGNPLVDRETRRRVDAKRYPEIVGTVTSAKRLDPDRLEITGDIAFRGEVQSVVGEVSVKSVEGTLIIDGEARLDVREWGLEPPRIALLRVHPEINVRIHLVTRPESASKPV